MQKNIKIYAILVTIFLFPAVCAYSAPETDIGSVFYGNLFFRMFAAIAAITILAAFITFFKTVFLFLEETKKSIYLEKGLEYLPQNTQTASLWDKLMKKMTDVVPVEREADVLLDHNYDGIKELDNNLPPWWVAMFYLSILFGVIYFAYYHIAGKGTSVKEQFEVEMAEAQLQQALYLERQSDKVNEQSVAMLVSSEDLGKGASIFSTNCASCHGIEGQGVTGLGPNLTDQYWIHGNGKVKDIFRIVKYGVIEKGMQSWEKDLRPRQIQEVSSFILSLQGTNPPNPKAPEGKLAAPDNGEPLPKDSAQVIGQIN